MIVILKHDIGILLLLDFVYLHVTFSMFVGFHPLDASHASGTFHSVVSPSLFWSMQLITANPHTHLYYIKICWYRMVTEIASKSVNHSFSELSPMTLGNQVVICASIPLLFCSERIIMALKYLILSAVSFAFSG